MKNFLRFLPILLLTALGAFGSVSSQTSRVAYTITVLPATCPTTFPFNLTVTVPGLVVLDGGAANAANSPPVTLTINSDYTVTGGGYNSQNQLQAGNVIVVTGGAHNVQVGDVITILRNVPFTQTTSFSSSGFMSPLMIEAGLDKLTLETQQLNDLFGLSLQFQKNEILSPLLQLSARESQSLGFTAAGAIAYSVGGGGGGTIYTAGTGLLLSANVFSVNAAQTLTSLTVTNPITGSVTGSAATATALATSRTINGVAFDGTANITAPAAAGTLTGTALPAAVTSAPGLLSAAVGSFGTMAIQNSTAVAVTGGTITGAAVTGLATPSAGTDAANKAYVDSVAVGLVVRSPVAVATTANLTLSAEQTIDGVLTSASRVLVKNQTAPAENGIYITAAGAWSRAADSNTAGQLLKGYYYFVSGGTTQGATSWTITTAPTVLNTDPVLFSQFSASQVYTAGTGLSLVGSAFSVNVAQPGITSLGTLTSLTVNGPAVTGSLTSTQGFRAGKATPSSGFLDVADEGANVYNALYSRDNANSTYLPFIVRAGNIIMAPGVDMAVFSSTGLAVTGLITASGSVSAGSTLTAGTTITAGTKIFPGTATFTIGDGSLFYSSTSGLSLAGKTGSAADFSLFGTSGKNLLSNPAGTNNLTIGNAAGVVTANTSIGFATAANVQTTKTNLNVTLNVKDYGAIGDGASNDTTAINAAIAALTNFSTLYFPAGSYLVTPGSITAFSSLSHVTIMGDGYSSQLTSPTAGAPGNFLVVSSSCDHMTLRDFAIIGSATSRGSGIGIRMYASYSFVSHIFIQGTSDFGMLITNDAGGYTREVQVSDCLSSQTLGDGFHFGYVTDSSLSNCQAYYTGDDGVGIGDDGATGFPPTRIEVINFQSIQAGNHAAGGTHGSGIRIFDGAVDIHIVGGSIYQSCEAGLQTTRATSTTAYNTRIKVDGLKVFQCLQVAGMYANISIAFANQVSITNCWSEAPVSQGCYAFLDCNNLVVTGNTAKDAVVRAFVTDDGTTTNVAATWSNWTFSGNVCLGTPSNESYYFVPATGKTIANLLVTGNTETGQSTTNYIFTNRLATAAKINNNTSMGGKAVANGGSGVAPTTANNN